MKSPQLLSAADEAPLAVRVAGDQVEVDEALETVARRGWLSEQPPDFRARLLEDARVRYCEHGTLVHEAGTPLTSFIGLADGSLEIFWDHHLLGRRLIHLAQPGIWLGEPLAYGVHSRMVTARARTRSCLVVISRRQIEALIRADPACLRYFGRLSDLHIRECLTGLVEALHDDPTARACARMTTLGLAHVRDKNDPSIRLPITQDELAKLCGMSRKSLGRILAGLKRAGLVDVRYGVVVLLDRERLSDIACGRKPE